MRRANVERTVKVRDVRGSGYRVGEEGVGGTACAGVCWLRVRRWLVRAEQRQRPRPSMR